MFETHFEKIYLAFFEDRIFQLRKMAVTELKVLFLLDYFQSKQKQPHIPDEHNDAFNH